MLGRELPLGFGMALAQNELAMQKFEAMTETAKQEVLQQAHNVASQAEMRKLISRLARH